MKRLLATTLTYIYLAGWFVFSAGKTAPNPRQRHGDGDGQAGNSTLDATLQFVEERASPESLIELDHLDSKVEGQQDQSRANATGLRRRLGVNQGESNVHISGNPLRMRDTSKTRIEIILINQTAILEPTCVKVIARAQRLLKGQLHFAPDTESYLQLFTIKEDVLFITRFDSDDAVGPRVFVETHAAFMKTKFPLAIISPFYGNLWYPFAGDNSASPCGQMIYNTLVRKFPIFQTNAYDLAQLKDIIRPKTTLTNFFTSEEGNFYMPMHYDHKDPEQYFRKFREQFKKNLPPNWLCGMNNLQHYASDCLLFFFSSSSDGIPGVIYTQTGLQSSLARAGHTDVDTLKYHRHYDASLEKTNPDVCTKGLAYFNVDMQEIVELREQYVRDKPKYAGHMDDVFVVKGSHAKGRDGEGEGSGGEP